MKEQIKNCIATRLGIDVEEIADDSDILDELGADSLEAVDILIELEELFDVQVPEEEAVELRTVAKIIDYLENN